MKNPIWHAGLLTSHRDRAGDVRNGSLAGALEGGLWCILNPKLGSQMGISVKIKGHFWVAFIAVAVVSGQPLPPHPQTVWFAPMDPALRTFDIGTPRSGSVDYLSLFNPSAPWPVAASHVQVFKVYTSLILESLPGSFSDDDLRQIFSYLNSHHIALAVEWGPLSSQVCGQGIEGFGGSAALPQATRIQQLGGNLQYIAMDEPFSHASLYSGPNACNWTPQQVAANALTQIALVKTVFPNVLVGDIEVVPDTGESPNWLNQYTAWLDTWRAAAGSPLAFFHFDVNWTVDWRPSVERLRQALVQRGIPFGMIYDGWPTDLTDADWVNDAESHYVSYETQGGTPPDHVIFQSWNDYPKHVLPESDPTTFTHLIDTYVRQRTSLSMNTTTNLVTGHLVSNQQPIPSAPIGVALQPTSGPGIVSNYVLSGAVPPSITKAVIQICVNLCGDVGTNDMNVYSFQYADSGGQTNLDVSKGLNGWGIDGNGTAVVQAASDASGKSLQISATASQQTFINSVQFAVTPGSSYSLTVQARIAPASVGSGYFALIFLAGTEVSRTTLAFAPGTLNLGTAQTGTDGSYSLSFAPQNPGAFQVQASYSGNDTLWPAYASGPLDFTPSIQSKGVVNGADFQVEPLGPGTWFTIFGQSFGQAGQWANPNTFTLGGASVSVCGLSAAVSYNSGPVTTSGVTGWQLNALMPDAVAGQTSCPVVVTVGGQTSQAVTINIASGIMELFGFPSSAGSLPIITHPDYSLVGPNSAGLIPAKPGETVIAWGTGDCSIPSLTAGGESAAVVFSGRVSPGLCQLNFAVPSGLSGENQLRISTSPNPYVLWVSP
jgi:uncharacterized protein (TIGR03437 family)